MTSASTGTSSTVSPNEGPNAPATLECQDIEKAFGGVPVLKGVSLALQPGTITALAGENGAGKSTLMKIASGQYRTDSGRVLVRGEDLPAGNAQIAHRLGVSIVPQELASVPDLSVYENIFIGREIKGLFGLNRKAMIEEARKNLKVFGLDMDPTTRMGALPVGLRQIIEIVKATNTGAKAILLDEPSSAIAEREVERLIAVMRTLRDRGVALLFTTHKMEEIRAVADRVVVLRDGGLVLDEPLISLTDDDIVTAMIGRELEDLFPERNTHGEETILEVDAVLVEGAGGPVSVTVRRGEIVGLAGLVGAGRTELLETIFGMRKAVEGEVRVEGRAVKKHSPSAAIEAKIAIVPEDRKGSGAILSMDVLDNASLPRLAHFSAAGFLKQGTRRAAVREATESVRLRSRGLSQEMGTLSGGNQQKVVLARWLTGPVDVLLLDEPTRGVDVGARSEIYRIIVELASQGMAVLMASSDMPEVLSLSHRALVMRGGEVAGELSREDLDRPDVQEKIFRLASGLSQ
ncbi:sugar ABC transporter ATP-binding protein [Arthrobacter sp. 31Y]|uniref:sugar ABC transporter ATP-binding protein n=1 Tax=Arthrobacter sp. 31Y TaxID=1115632 RepID=UPI0009DF5315|nr:sugar ABC transporter ATP-binding protein [Arthrobacter sp. 31Y]